MSRITLIVFCVALSLSGLMAKHLVRRSNECEAEDGSEFTCPRADGMFPHRQCTKFWHCSNCLAYEKECPSDLYWNDEEQICDWPEDVPDTDCIPPAVKPLPTTQEPTSTVSPSEPTTEESTTTPVPNEESTTGSSGDETTTQGSGEETTTQENTEETTTEGSTDETTEGTTEATTSADESTTTTQETTTGSEDTTEDPSKPNCKELGDGYYKHSECTKFWQCGNGIAYEMTCAPGTAWDDELKVCNWPSAVNCQLFLS